MTRAAEIAKAREVDTRIAAAWAAYYEAADQIAELKKSIKDAHKTIARPHMNTNVKLAMQARIEKNAAKIAELDPQADALAEVANGIEAAEYEGWSRFFLVQHIHRSRSCSSFRPTTRIGWLPDVSGLTEAEAVKEHGAILCTLCFPSAPVAWTRGTQDPTTCPGSGKPIDRSLPNRNGFYSGNWATCPECGKKPGVRNGALNIPKHKA